MAASHIAQEIERTRRQLSNLKQALEGGFSNCRDVLT